MHVNESYLFNLFLVVVESKFCFVFQCFFGFQQCFYFHCFSSPSLVTIIIIESSVLNTYSSSLILLNISLQILIQSVAWLN